MLLQEYIFRFKRIPVELKNGDGVEHIVAEFIFRLQYNTPILGGGVDS